MEIKQTNEVHEDHACPICLTAFYLPIQITQCKHIFCQPCLEDSAILSGKRKCPLCRTSYSPQNINNQEKLWSEILKAYPHIIEEKKKHIKAKKLLNLSIGNRTTLIQRNGDNWYEWTMFVKSAEGQKPLNEYAKKVQIKLHETFKPNIIIYDMKNLNEVKLKRQGWGTFRINIKIIWKDSFEQKQTELYHDLEFESIVQKQIGCYLHQKKAINV